VTATASSGHHKQRHAGVTRVTNSVTWPNKRHAGVTHRVTRLRGVRRASQHNAAGNRATWGGGR
jgi:hypothetical protein